MYSVLPNVGVPTESTLYEWATHFGPSSSLKSGYNNPSSVQLLYLWMPPVQRCCFSCNDNVGADNTGDLIELGFFDLIQMRPHVYPKHYR